MLVWSLLIIVNNYICYNIPLYIIKYKIYINRISIYDVANYNFKWFYRSRHTRGGTVRQQTTPVSWQSAVHLCRFFASGQFAVAELILNSTTKPPRRRPDPTPADGGRHTSESRAYCQVSLSCTCPIRHQSRSKLFWLGACEMFRTLKCSTVSEK